MTKTTTLSFNQFEVNLLIKAAKHMIDAYKDMDNPAVKATVTNYRKLQKRLSRAASRLASNC